MMSFKESTRREEFRQALKETRKYIFSHHRPEEYYRCYSFSFQERSIHLCARCTGIYPGILLMSYLISSGSSLNLVATAFLPVPTVIEKYLTGKPEIKGYNSIRTVTGFLLGISYVNGLYLVTKNPSNLYALSLGLIYLVIAGFLIKRETGTLF